MVKAPITQVAWSRERSELASRTDDEVMQRSRRFDLRGTLRDSSLAIRRIPRLEEVKVNLEFEKWTPSLGLNFSRGAAASNRSIDVG